MIGTTEWIIILVLAVLLFGGSQIPKLAKALGRAKRDFQDGMKEGEESSVKDRIAEKKDAAQAESKPGAGKS